MQILLAILSIPFFYFNYKIIVSDIKEKKIPNKYLLYLLLLIPFYYIYIFYNFDINILQIIFKLSLSIFLSFLLYYYWIWSAGDAKYLLVLSIFVPNIGILSFIWNIALLTILYLSIYFLYFYFYKIWLDKVYRKSIFSDIIKHNKEQIEIFFQKGQIWKDRKKIIFLKILKIILVFLTIFAILRLWRIYLFDFIKDYYQNSNDSNFNDNLKENITYIVWGSILLFIALYVFLRRLLLLIVRLFFIYVVKKIFKKDFSKNDIKNSLLFLLILSLITFIIFEFVKNWKDIFDKLYLVFTLYLIIYLLVRLLIYSYKLTFQIAEQDFININNLKEWDIIDKKYLINIFWTQKCLWFWENKEWLLYPSPENYLNDISIPINKEDIEKLKQMYDIVEKYHIKNKTIGFEAKKDLKILKTFSFWIYIFVWFIITYFIQNKIFSFLIDWLTKIVEKFYTI